MLEMHLHNLYSGQPDQEAEDRDILITRFPFLIGRRDPCDHLLHHPMVSRKHCLFFQEGEDVRVSDLQSLNGTFLNGRPVTGDQLVRDGDLLQIGILFFRVHLGAPALAESGAVNGATAAGHSKRQVLVVEDNADTAATLALLLHEWGHEVHVAHDGGEALRAFQEHAPDTVLLDIHLPGMNGYEVAEHLRDQKGKDKARVVALTGYVSDIDRRRSREAGFDVLLTKPVDPETLGQALCPP